jgi:hypothetical protein
VAVEVTESVIATVLMVVLVVVVVLVTVAVPPSITVVDEMVEIPVTTGTVTVVDAVLVLVVEPELPPDPT